MKKELFRYIISGILVLAAGIIYIVNFPEPGEKIECVIEETGIKETENADDALQGTGAPQTASAKNGHSNTEDSDTEDSASEQEKPGNKGKVPTKAEKPETDGKTPEGDDKEPEADGKTPEGDEKTPKADEETSEGDGKTSEAAGKEPEIAEETPEGDGKKDDDIQISESGRININTAGPEELMKLSGIGQVRANSIIKYREENGDFETVEDIMKVPGIKMGIYRKISEYITVD